MRRDTNFKGSDSSDPSVYFLFCGLEFSKWPVTAKLADVGESRASNAQAQTLIKSKTRRINCGTLVFMPPEIHMATYTESNREDMKETNIWSYGMTIFLKNTLYFLPKQNGMCRLGVNCS